MTGSGPGQAKAATLPPHNKEVAGSGRLRRPPSQPAPTVWYLGARFQSGL